MCVRVCVPQYIGGLHTRPYAGGQHSLIILFCVTALRLKPLSSRFIPKKYAACSPGTCRVASATGRGCGAPSGLAGALLGAPLDVVSPVFGPALGFPTDNTPGPHLSVSFPGSSVAGRPSTCHWEGVLHAMH